jgi:hypothetical protein
VSRDSSGSEIKLDIGEFFVQKQLGPQRATLLRFVVDNAGFAHVWSFSSATLHFLFEYPNRTGSNE